MACQDIGEANPDVAGIGVRMPSHPWPIIQAASNSSAQILLAFAIQGAIAVVLSIYCLLVGLTWQSRVRAVNLDFIIWPVAKVYERITRCPGRLHRYHIICQNILRFLEDPVPKRTDKGIQKQKLAKDILVAGSDTQSWTGNYRAIVEQTNKVLTFKVLRC
jgi:hypothetical protein